ncbi:MAG: winged helix-turn-helix transcriptional regulator [Promethearchaeota archaeon]|jgi:DNA-binding Lrp family transcriptional regulator
MDKTDFFLVKTLSFDSRLTYRELAYMTDMSVSAIHKRIRNLEEEEVIRTYTARPSFVALNYLLVLIFGTSRAKSMDAINKELGQHESIYYVVNTGGKYLYISALIRDLSELQEFGSYVTKTAQMSEPTIGIVNQYLSFPVTRRTLPEPLTSIDYKILKTLNRDSRKTITDISDDVGISAKTVRKRLDRMWEHNLAAFSIEWTAHRISFVTTFNIHINEGQDMNSTIQHLYQKYSENVAYCIAYSNIPHFLTLHTWAETARESQKIQEQLQTEGFKDIIPHIILTGNYYECWIDQLLRTK